MHRMGDAISNQVSAAVNIQQLFRRGCRVKQDYVWVFEGVSVTFTNMTIPASNCGDQALMSFAISKFLLAKFCNQDLTHVCLNAEVMVEAPPMLNHQE